MISKNDEEIHFLSTNKMFMKVWRQGYRLLTANVDEFE